MSLRTFFGQFVKRRPKLEVLYTSTETAEQRGKEWKMMEEVPFPSDGHTCRCPNCGNDQFYEGPSGGLATNVECAQCHLRWNANNVGLSWQFIGFTPERQEVEDMLTTTRLDDMNEAWPGPTDEDQRT